MAEAGDRGPPVNPFQVVVAVVVVAAILIGYLVASRPQAPSPPPAIQIGDTVDVDYIGFFEDGRVFDTSFQTVAENNASYPKAASFNYRTVYRPLSFTLAGTEGRALIPGFEAGLLEPTPMRVGETREIVVPPAQGYGDPDPALIEGRPLEVELTRFETLSLSEFRSLFDQEPVVYLNLVHPVWGWPVTVQQVQGDVVTILHLAVEGDVVQPYGAWPARVREVETAANGGLGRIVVEHLLDDTHVDRVQAEDEAGTFRVTAVDREAGTYTVDYNLEVVGRTLVFRVTLLRIHG